MFQFCCSLVTAAFRGRSILNKNSALLKWKWETFYLECVKINRLIFFIIKMSKWMLLLFGIFPRFFHFWLKLLTQVQKKMVLMICLQYVHFFLPGQKQYMTEPEGQKSPQPAAEATPANGSCPPAEICAQEATTTSGLVRKRQWVGAAQHSCFWTLFLFAKLSVRGRKENKNLYFWLQSC